MTISLEGKGKNQLESGQLCMQDSPVLLHYSLLRTLWPKWPVCWSIVVKQKTIFSFSISRDISFWSIPKTKKGVTVQLFIHSFTVRDELIKDNALEVKNCGKIRKRIPGIFWSCYVFRSFSEIVTSLLAGRHFSERLTFTECSKAKREDFLINPQTANVENMESS